MDEEIMTNDEVMDEEEIENSEEEVEEEETEDSTGFPVIPVMIGSVLTAGVAAVVANRKKIGAFIAEKRANHAKKVLEDYEKNSILYEVADRKDNDEESEE